MTDIETQTEHHIAQAVAYLEKANQNLWMAAYHAHPVWRTYADFAITDIARRANKERSSIENYCHAYDLYNDLKAYATRSELFRIRHAVTISHFWTAWALRNNYPQATTQKCLIWLGQAGLHRPKWSAETMKTEALREMNISQSPPKVETVRNGLRNYAAWILAMVDNFDAWEVATAHAIDRHYGDGDAKR